jgi:tetratricopeptide (TPR) repeat protein
VDGLKLSSRSRNGINMSLDEKTQQITQPNLGLLSLSQARTVRAVLDDLTKSNFDARQIFPYLSELTARIRSASVSEDDQIRMAEELGHWVRWHRLQGYWLAYLFQLAMQQQQSAYFVIGCLLYADAQINVNSDLSLPSLENGYNALAQQKDPHLRNKAAYIETRIRTVFNYYRSLYSATPYDRINPLTEHLYSWKTWHDLAAAFPELQKPRRELTPPDYLKVIDQCVASGDTYWCVLTRRFLGSVYEGRNELDAAAQQFQLALQGAKSASLDTEIGHLHRLYGYVLRNSGKLDEATREFQDAYSHESQPLFSYWQALSARELGDVQLRHLLHEIDPAHLPKETLQAGLRWYKIGRSLFERHVAECVVPVARAVEQQLFRSYVDNSIELAVVAGGRDSVAEMEASGPRYATEVVAEGKATAALDAAAHAQYLHSRAIFHEHLGAFTQHDFDKDFRDYLVSVETNREARQFYMRTRVRLSNHIAQAQLSDATVVKLFDMRIPNVAFLMFHIASQETYTWLFFPGADMPIRKTRRQAGTWQVCDQAFQGVLQAAKFPPSAHPAPAMRSAIDTLLAVYAECFNPFLEPFLPALQGKHLKLFPRFSMNAVPFHALKVKGKPLIEYCDVSYGQTLGMFFQVHRDPPSLHPGTLGAVFDEAGTVAYKGTFRMLDADNDHNVYVLPNSSWEDARMAISSRRPSDLFFACHGEYDRDDPAKSFLRIRSDQNVSFSEIFSKLDLSGCRSVTLGACESGIARTLVSAEYIGLPIAFLAAGAQYVIASLWQVNQIAAAILLGHHYRLLRDGKHGVVAALNEAQRMTMRMSQDEVVTWLNKFVPEKARDWEPFVREMEDPPFAHPYYWAGFYVTGDL